MFTDVTWCPLQNLVPEAKLVSPVMVQCVVIVSIGIVIFVVFVFDIHSSVLDILMLTHLQLNYTLSGKLWACCGCKTMRSDSPNTGLIALKHSKVKAVRTIYHHRGFGIQINPREEDFSTTVDHRRWKSLVWWSLLWLIRQIHTKTNRCNWCNLRHHTWDTDTCHKQITSRCWDASYHVSMIARDIVKKSIKNGQY